MEYTNSYVLPTLTVDAVVFQLIRNSLQVLLIERSQEPFKGSWALPGGYVAGGETTFEALQRVLRTNVGVNLNSDLRHIEQLYTFDTITSDPRRNTVSVTYMATGDAIAWYKAEAHTGFFPVANLPILAHEHNNVISYAHERLKAKLTYTNAIFSLLPQRFTLSQLQTSYEAIFGKQLDKRNFQKKILSLDLLKETDEYYRKGNHRPAKYYEFTSNSLTVLPRHFF